VDEAEEVIAPEPEQDEHKLDELTLRAIRAVHEELKKKNPEYANRFAKLPPKKMKEAVWKLVK
jgi:DNA-directed RNA polymerase subunit F